MINNKKCISCSKYEKNISKLKSAVHKKDMEKFLEVLVEVIVQSILREASIIIDDGVYKINIIKK